MNRWPAAAILVVAAALSLPACAINPPLRVADAMPGDADAGVLLLDVPFHPQTEMQCGPAALATVLGASGVDITPEALAPQVYLPERGGSLQLELVGASRRAGRIPYRVERTPEALLAELEAGRPVLVLQNLLVRTVPKWHYAVLVGADPQGNRMILNSGEERGLEVRAPSFLRTWDWGGRWAIVTLRPGELPARPDPTTYLTAVADFEAVAGAAAAKPAWQSALRQWPSDPRPHLALGNQAHAAGDERAAVRHYRAGLALAPRRSGAGQQPGQRAGEIRLPARSPPSPRGGPRRAGGGQSVAPQPGTDCARHRRLQAAQQGLRCIALSEGVRFSADGTRGRNPASSDPVRGA